MFQLTQKIEIDLYEKAVQTLQHYNISLDGLPSREDVEKWLFNLPVKTMEEISSWGSSAVLVFVPPMKTINYLEKIGGKNWWPEFWDTVGSEKWKFAITKAVENNAFDESLYYADFPENKTSRINEQMVAESKKRFAAKSVGIMPPYGYVPTAASQLAEGKVLDRTTYTAFERPADARYLPNAGWDDDLAGLDGYSPDISGEYLRCLPWVEGEMGD